MRTPAWQATAASNTNAALVQSAIEPTGTGPYVEAVREWIDRVTPRAPQLRLVR